MSSIDIGLSMDLASATVGGNLMLPQGVKQGPCVVIAGGTLSPLRDGGTNRPGLPQRTALKRFAEALARSGYLSFRYDQVGHGESTAKAGWQDLYRGDARVLSEICEYLRARPECTRIVIAGESAGAYIACLAASEGLHADAYLFLGAFCGKAEEIFAFNHGRFAQYVAGDPRNEQWARDQKLERYIAFGRAWPRMFEAARKREPAWELEEGNFRETVPLARRTEELDFPPDEMFRHIRGPALAVAGARDRNVPPHHAAEAVAIMQRAGNLQTQSAVIPEADHNFQIAPADEDAAIRERFTFASFSNPYHSGLDQTVLTWLHQYVPAERVRELATPELELQTADSPERLHLAAGVTVIEDILDESKTPGVETLEGRIGPLLRAPGMRAHFIDMPAGLFLEEHPHAKGSIIYTVRGRWGLKSHGRWRLMQPGSLYWFGDDVPTGFQVPFATNAFLLIFKAVPGERDAAFMDYLRGLAGRLLVEQAEGTPFRLADLPPGHPALDFAREVNPDFDQPGAHSNPNPLSLRITSRPFVLSGDSDQ